MPNRPSRNRTWFIVTLVLVVAGIVAYFVGGALARIEGAQRMNVALADVQAARTQLAASQSVDRLVRASNATYRAAAALDNRNFGTANARILEAIADLKTVDATAAGVDPPKLAALENQAAAIKISVTTTNLDLQRAALLTLANAIEAVTPRPTTP